MGTEYESLPQSADANRRPFQVRIGNSTVGDQTVNLDL